MGFRGSNLHRKSLVGRPIESTDARLGACVNGLVRGNYSGKGAAQTFQGQFMKGSGTGWGRPVPIKLAFYWANLGTVPTLFMNWPCYRLGVKVAKTISDFRRDTCQTYFNENFRRFGNLL